jgi:hypothetical protein
MVLLQAGQVTRPTFWQIGPVGTAVFYYLAAVALLVFVVGLSQRVTSYTQGRADPFPRFDDLPGRILAGARLALSNEKQLDCDVTAGLMHAAIVWGFLTLLIGTTVLGIDMDLYRPLAGDSVFLGDFYLSDSLVMDAMGLFFLVGLAVARTDRLWGKHTSREDDLFLGSLFLLGVGGYVTEAVRVLGQNFPADETVSFVGYFLALVGEAAAV